MRRLSFHILLCLSSVGLVMSLSGRDAWASGEVVTFSTQKINVNKAHSPQNDIAPASGAPDMNIEAPLISIAEENVINTDPSPDDMTEGVLAVKSGASLDNAPDDISDMVSDITVEADLKAKDSFGYILAPDDKIKITVFGEQDLSGDFVVGNDGTITFPLIGNITVEGKNAAQLADHVTEMLTGDYLKDPNVSVEVIQNRPFYILGEVREPGSYDFVNGMNILKAVAISGGFTYRANRKSIDVIRGAGPKGEPEKMKPHAFVQPGDVIYVRERFF